MIRRYIPTTDLTGAVLSQCRTYRYLLWRNWQEELPTCCFIGLNPSTADETEDDHTIRRCIGFSKAWGCGGVVMLNLFAFRATDPKDLIAANDSVGDENDRFIIHNTRNADIVVAAWSAKGAFLGRDKKVMQFVKNLRCLGKTKNGHPRHPSRMPNSATLVWFP